MLIVARAAFILFVALAIPLTVFPWGTIEDIRYKIKGADGNLWEYLLGGGPVVMGAERPGTLAFTFDDGPDHRTTPILLDQLDRYDVKGAFFVNASKFHPRTAGGLENQAVLRDIYRRGHFIGSHTFSHQDITKLDDQGWRTEVVQAEQVLQGITGKRPWLFRPPFGRMNSDTASRLARSGYTVIMWNLDSGDWKAKNALQVLETTKRVIEENPEGGVLLFHDTNRSAVEAIPLIIEWIDERNARLMAEGKPQLKIVGLEHYIRSQRR